MNTAGPKTAQTRQQHRPRHRMPGYRHRTVLAIGGVALLTAAIAAIALVRLHAATPGKGPHGAELIAPPEAPYSFEMPSGWVHAVRDGRAPSYLWSVGAPLGNGHSDAVVSVEVMHDNTADQAKQLFHLSRQNIPPADSGWTVQTLTTPAGPARQVSFRGGGPGGRYYFYDQPESGPVFVTCQWIRADSAEQSLHACAQVIDTLKIKS